MNIETKRLIVRAVEPKDARFLTDLINDPSVRSGLGAYDLVFPVSLDMEQRWIESVSKSNDAHMIMTLRDGGSPIGMVSLEDINERDGSARFEIMIAEKVWGKGYISETIDGVLGFVFDRMNMHRIWLRVAEENRRASACYRKSGFKEEGVLREDHFSGDEWHNSIVMSVLDSEYRRRAR